jgi:hypothetical protein
MQDTAEITLAITKDTFGKLAELAGSESYIDEYLTQLVLLLHARKCGQVKQVELEQAVIEIDELLKKEAMYKQEIRSLEQQLSRVLAGKSGFLEVLCESQQLLRRDKAVLH